MAKKTKIISKYSAEKLLDIVQQQMTNHALFKTFKSAEDVYDTNLNAVSVGTNRILSTITTEKNDDGKITFTLNIYQRFYPAPENGFVPHDNEKPYATITGEFFTVNGNLDLTTIIPKISQIRQFLPDEELNTGEFKTKKQQRVFWEDIPDTFEKLFTYVFESIEYVAANQ